MCTERTTPQVVVGAAIVVDGRVLACARADPPEIAGRWEFPGGKVEPGEAETDALIRECAEELAVKVSIGARIGPDVPLGDGRAVLRVYTARLVGDAEPRPLEHAELRWLSHDTLFTVDWLPGDVPVAEALLPLLAS